MMTKKDAAIIKGMLSRGDKQQWIAAWFGGELNAGRIAEINTGERFKEIKPQTKNLPPPGPYASGQAVHKALLALMAVQEVINNAIQALHNVEQEDNDE